MLFSPLRSEKQILADYVFQVSAFVLYDSWLDSGIYSMILGERCHLSSEIGGENSYCGGLFTGRNIELSPCYSIVQTWRSTDFLDYDDDSIVDIKLVPITTDKTRLYLTHSNLPFGFYRTKFCWETYCFKKMARFYEQLSADSVAWEKDSKSKVSPWF